MLDVVREGQKIGCVAVATTFGARLRGLMFRRSLRTCDGMIFWHCRNLHTHFMLLVIDVVFLDASLCVISIKKSVRPWRIVGCRAAVHALELISGTCERQNIGIGDHLAFSDTYLES